MKENESDQPDREQRDRELVALVARLDFSIRPLVGSHAAMPETLDPVRHAKILNRLPSAVPDTFVSSELKRQFHSNVHWKNTNHLA